MVWASLMETKQMVKENARAIKETGRAIKETDRQMKKTDRKLGELGNRFGELAEHLVAPNITEKFKKLGFSLEQISQNHEISENGRYLTEIDLLLENGEIVMVVEIKARPNLKNIQKHIKRIEILRRRADARNDTRKFQGAIAGAIMRNEIRESIHKAGFYAIEQKGDTVKIVVPEGFKPREW